MKNIIELKDYIPKTKNGKAIKWGYNKGLSFIEVPTPWAHYIFHDLGSKQAVTLFWEITNHLKSMEGCYYRLDKEEGQYYIGINVTSESAAALLQEANKFSLIIDTVRKVIEKGKMKKSS